MAPQLNRTLINTQFTSFIAVLPIRQFYLCIYSDAAQMRPHERASPACLPLF
jgi:hypothetical protein